MGFLQALERRMATGATGALADSWYQPGGFFYGGPGIKTKSGSSISEFNAMQLAVVWCCIKILSEDSASLPLHLYRRLPGGGKEKAVNHPLYPLLHDSPNREMTAFTFRETGKSHLLTWGNWYAEKEFGRGSLGRDRVVALWPIAPHRVTPKRNRGETTKVPRNEIYYHVSMAGTDLPDVDLPRRNILHIPGLSYNGLVGYSPIAACREAVGLGKTLEEFGASYFESGIHPSLVLSHTGQFKDPKAVRQAYEETYTGLGKQHRIFLIEEASKVEKIGIPNDEAQFLETRKFQNVDIGTRIYRLPPQMYGEYDKASTYASAEQFSLDYVVKTLRPWLVRDEQAMNMSLIPEAERGEYFFEHLIDGLMRGDAAARADFYSKLFPVAGITPNQICEIENWNPIGPEGDRRFVPLNMVPLDEAGKIQEEKTPAQNNRAVYRSRLESAYLRLFVDAIGRVTRQESQRISWLRKNEGDVDAFYRDFPDYIRKQALPVFLSLGEALSGMESELSGLKYDSLRPEIERFSALFCEKFSTHYIDESRLRASGERPDTPERDAGEIARVQIGAFSGEFLAHLRAVSGAKQ